MDASVDEFLGVVVEPWNGQEGDAVISFFMRKKRQHWILKRWLRSNH